MVKQIVMVSPMHTMPRLENENISHPKLYCCAPFSQACALWPAGSDMPCEPETPIRGVYAFGGGGSGAAMRLGGIRSV